MCACDIQNSHLETPSSEKHYSIENAEKCAIIFRDLHGAKYYEAYYWRRLCSVMEDVGFPSSKADPYVWLRYALKSNRVEHFQHVLLCTEDILQIMEDPERFLREKLGK